MALPRFGRIDAALVLFVVPAVVMAVGLALFHDRQWVLVAAAGCGVALLLRRDPPLAAVAIVCTSLFLRLSYIGIGYSTQVDHARTAAAHALTGASPYGVLFPSLTAPPEPFTYGPLALLWWQPGVAVEVVAVVAVMGLLVWTQSWLTLALYAGLPFAVYLTPTGVNDYSPGLLIAVALLLSRQHPVAGAAVLAVAAAIKPYAAAWFLPFIGYAGSHAATVLIGVTALLWSPLVVWGPSTFLRSIQLHSDVHPLPQNAVNLPALRWLAFPIAAAGLFARRWDHMVLLGSGAFILFLFFDRWASLGYWLAVLPIAGIALEERLLGSVERTDAARARPTSPMKSETP